MDAKTIFDRAASDYDRPRRQLVPCFDDFYGTALDLIPHEVEAHIRVLDVGAGTGLLSAMVASAFPQAQLTLADVSTEMLAKATQRFEGRPNIGYVVLDFEKDALPGQYDVVVSALALHHTPQPNLRGVFHKIYEVLVPGGTFINADQTLGTTDENEQRYEEVWRQGVKARGGTEEDIQAAVERMKADKTATLEDQLRWLREAGFQHVDCWYKNYRFTVYSGRKPTT
jgi:tRNA (cmo5U34)-methyltransferase